MDEATITIKGEEVGAILIMPKVYSTGKTGFWGQQKLAIGGEAYQAQVQIVKITPKAK